MCQLRSCQRHDSYTRNTIEVHREVWHTIPGLLRATGTAEVIVRLAVSVELRLCDRQTESDSSSPLKGCGGDCGPCEK